jgi:hypothetical protein
MAIDKGEEMGGVYIYIITRNNRFTGIDGIVGVYSTYVDAWEDAQKMNAATGRFVFEVEEYKLKGDNQ